MEEYDHQLYRRPQMTGQAREEEEEEEGACCGRCGEKVQQKNDNSTDHIHQHEPLLS